MTTSTMEMQRDIQGYIKEHSPVEIPITTDKVLALGKLAGHPLGSEPELGLVTAEAVQILEDEGRIATTEKDDIQVVEYIEPLEHSEPVFYNATQLFGESDALWDKAAELNQQLLQEPDPTVSEIRQELNAIYDQLGEIFNRP